MQINTSRNLLQSFCRLVFQSFINSTYFNRSIDYNNTIEKIFRKSIIVKILSQSFNYVTQFSWSSIWRVFRIQKICFYRIWFVNNEMNFVKKVICKSFDSIFFNLIFQFFVNISFQFLLVNVWLTFTIKQVDVV